MIRDAIWLSILAALTSGAAAAAELTLEFPGLRDGGKVSVAVFSTETGWDRRAQPAWAEVRAVDGGALQLSRALPPGDYAVMAYHDRNGNGRLDTLPVGLPTEPYGFSNNSRGVFGPPNWKAASFRLGDGGVRQVIRLR